MKDFNPNRLKKKPEEDKKKLSDFKPNRLKKKAEYEKESAS